LPLFFNANYNLSLAVFNISKILVIFFIFFLLMFDIQTIHVTIFQFDFSNSKNISGAISPNQSGASNEQLLL